MDYQLPISVSDFTAGSLWGALSAAIINAGPLSVCPSVDVPKEDSSICQLYSPLFSTKESTDSICHLFLLEYDSKFDTNQTAAVNIWRSKNPDKQYLVVVLILTKSRWTVTNQKGKVETAAMAAMHDCRLCAVKYLTSDQAGCSESDVKLIHSSIESVVAQAYTSRISSLQTELLLMDAMTPKKVKATCELAHLFHIFGYFRQSVELYQKARDVRGVPFWPDSPQWVDVRKASEGASYETGYDVQMLCLCGIMKSTLTMKSYHEDAENVFYCFSKLLNKAKNEEQEMFARLWIEHTCMNFYEMLENNTDSADISENFAVAAFRQVLQIYKLDFDPNKTIFAHVPQEVKDEIRDTEAKNQFFDDRYDRLKGVFKSYVNHSEFLHAEHFFSLLREGEEDRAYDILSRSSLWPKKIRKRSWLLESAILEYLFEKNEKLKSAAAKAILSSNAKDDLKKRAVAFLGEKPRCVQPMVSLNQVVNCASFVEQHELFDYVEYTVALTLPSWLCGYNATVWTRLDSEKLGEDYSLCGEKVDMVLERDMRITSKIMCSSVADFGFVCVCIVINKMTLLWRFELDFHLIVVEPKEGTSFDLKVPFLLVPKTEQCAIFVAEKVDPSTVEITLSFVMPGLRAIRQKTDDGKVLEYPPSNPLKLTHFGQKIEIMLVHEFKHANSDGDYVTVNISSLRRDGYLSKTSQGFQVPPIRKMGIRLFNQTRKMQQFQIINPFPERFSFDFNGTKHIVPPYEKYCVVREASEAPLELVMVEEGWEDFPVKVRSAPVNMNPTRVQLKFENHRWRVGNAMIITADPPSFPMIEENDWVINTIDLKGACHVFIPLRPGKLKLPKFQMGQQVCETVPQQVEIDTSDFPPFTPL